MLLVLRSYGGSYGTISTQISDKSTGRIAYNSWQFQVPIGKAELLRLEKDATRTITFDFSAWNNKFYTCGYYGADK